MAQLAIKGGKKVREKPFPNQLDWFDTEIVEQQIKKLLGDKVFSRYRGNATANFFGGHWVREVENLLSAEINCENVLVVNSCTSALYIACAAIGLKPGDEVIVTPWSMSCSATIPLLFGATPVFADIEYDYFCIDPLKVAEKITPRTKAIIVVDLFGQPADYELLMNLAKQYNLYIIEDAAQAIGSYMRPALYADESLISKEKRLYSGTFGHIGCFSFTQGKHFTCGEGGAIVTNSEELYRKCALIRNHSEAVISDAASGSLVGDTRLDNNYCLTDSALVGGNFRLTELQAIVLYYQLQGWDKVMEIRRENVTVLKDIQVIPYITTAKPRPGAEHSYYVMPFTYHNNIAPVHRDTFIEAVKAELSEERGRVDRGIPISGGYIKPLYLMPLFRYKANYFIKDREYKERDCPVCEKLWKDDFFLTLYNGLPLEGRDRVDIIEAFYKVYKNIDELRKQ